MADGTRFTPVQPVRSYQRIVEQVEEALARGDLQPGHRLPSERELVAQFQVSRSTVREALRVLESNGIVRSRPGDPNGPEVLAFSPRALRKQMVRLARVDEVGLAELVSFRMILDGSANMLAARLHTPDQLKEMEATIDAMEAAVDAGYEEFSKADLAFHEAVGRASRNTLIQLCNEVVREVVLSLISEKISRSRQSRSLMLTSLAHHRRVLSAVRAGDGLAAAEAARRSLYDYYVGYVPKADRASLQALLLDADEADPGQAQRMGRPPVTATRAPEM
jgi:GntR family transcriptional regulator, transcriptional repressor for pyruvate dehydrogenase complex